VESLLASNLGDRDGRDERSGLGCTSAGASATESAQIGRCRIPLLEGQGQEQLNSARPFVPSHSRLPPPSTTSLFSVADASPGYDLRFPESNGRLISPPLISYPGIMPVQTKSRNKSGPTSDPFDDPNAIRVVPPVPPKVPSKRDVGADTQRDATNARNQEPQRARPIRSQTQQNVGSVTLMHSSA